jgi:hypothetical protein
VPLHLLGSFAYKTQSGTLFTVGQTVGQPARTVTDISDPAHAPGAILACVPRQRFCPDTEEVTGSNPSPTEKALVSYPFCDLARACGGWIVDPVGQTVGLSVGVAIEKLVDGARPTCDHWAQFLPIHALGDACTSMADQVCDLLDGHPELDSKDTKLCRNSRGVDSLGFSPAALATRRNERRTLAASSADPCRVQNTRRRSPTKAPPRLF